MGAFCVVGGGVRAGVKSSIEQPVAIITKATTQATMKPMGKHRMSHASYISPRPGQLRPHCCHHCGRGHPQRLAVIRVLAAVNRGRVSDQLSSTTHYPIRYVK